VEKNTLYTKDIFYPSKIGQNSLSVCVYVKGVKMLQASHTERNSSTKLKPGYFDHEKWDVYQVALEFVALTSEIIKKLERGNGSLADQLLRAGTSVPLNIAEGAGEHSANEKARFYRMAKRSATECASILDVFKKLKIIDDNDHLKGRELLLRIVAMLTKMVRVNPAHDNSG
jgi:four helix bundle protein